MCLISCFLLESNHIEKQLISYIIYTCSIYSYDDINYTYLYASNDHRLLITNIIATQWSRFGGGGGATIY